MCSFYQFTILSIFEEITEITYENLRTRINLPKNILDHHLKALFNQNPQNSLLLKENFSSPICTDKERLSLNLEFCSLQLKRNFIPSLINYKKNLVKENKKEISENEAEILIKERNYIIETTIMKIMKVFFG